MGRHSAPDEPDDADGSSDGTGVPGAVAVAVRESGSRRPAPGRHAQPADESDAATASSAEPSAASASDAPTAAAPTLDGPAAGARELDQPAPAVPAPSTSDASPAGRSRASAPAAVRGVAHNSAADLHLVRSHPAVLALCGLALVAPFVAELVVLLARGELSGHRYLVWLWIPLIAAGVLVGLVLDVSHRRHAPPSP